MSSDPGTTTLCYDVQRQKPHLLLTRHSKLSLSLVLSHFMYAKYLERVSGEKKRKADTDTST